MGGYGSGRPGWRVDIESTRRLDIRCLRRMEVLGSGRNGSLTWDQDGEPCGSIGYRNICGAIELDYAVTDDDGSKIPIRITVPLRSMPCRFGGERTYFVCPHCYRWCEVIVMTTNGRNWACRRCLSLRYRSQSLTPADRIQRRADALYARAGVEDEAGLIHKHKWMRWRTFNRLMEAADNLSLTADAAFAFRIMRLFGMTPEDLFDDVAGT